MTPQRAALPLILSCVAGCAGMGEVRVTVTHQPPETREFYLVCESGGRLQQLREDDRDPSFPERWDIVAAHEWRRGVPWPEADRYGVLVFDKRRFWTIRWFSPAEARGPGDGANDRRLDLRGKAAGPPLRDGELIALGIRRGLSRIDWDHTPGSLSPGEPRQAVPGYQMKYSTGEMLRLVKAAEDLLARGYVEDAYGPASEVLDECERLRFFGDIPELPLRMAIDNVFDDFRRVEQACAVADETSVRKELQVMERHVRQLPLDAWNR